MPIGEALFCLGVFLISTQQEAFHGIYRYMVPLVPLTLAISRDDRKVRHRIIAFNLVFGVADDAGIRHAQPADGLRTTAGVG